MGGDKTSKNPKPLLGTGGSSPKGGGSPPLVVKGSPELPLTVAFIRDCVRGNHYYGNVFDGLAYMLKEYDKVYSELGKYQDRNQYSVSHEAG